ncbi:MAG: TMEM165/GDT1 family protein [Propionibacteriales bacterium]|nr:TMEM165/GDT1 family protein [Propionibacteriales bacterium]
MTAAEWGLLTSSFLASFVECVEALTIVLAMGVTRGWRAAIAGTLTALVALAGFTLVAGYALATWLPTSALQLVVGTLLLIFGLQWLRKAILRSAGLKSLHDEQEAYDEQTAAALGARSNTVLGLDAFGYLVSLKAVFLEGVEVVFIVLTFGLNAGNVPLAATGGAAAAVVVSSLGMLVHRPLASIPENTLKYVVGLMLVSFGTFWSMEGLGVFSASGSSLEWPGGDWAILALLVFWTLWSLALVGWLRGPVSTPRDDPAREVLA